MTTDEILKLARELIEAREKATPGEWDHMGEDCEVHATDFIDGGGDPFHICPRVNNQANTEFICYAANHTATIAQALLDAHKRIEELEKLNRWDDWNYDR